MKTKLLTVEEQAAILAALAVIRKAKQDQNPIVEGVDVGNILDDLIELFRSGPMIVLNLEQRSKVPMPGEDS